MLLALSTEKSDLRLKITECTLEQENLSFFLFSFGTFDSFLAGFSYSKCCYAETAQKPV